MTTNLDEGAIKILNDAADLLDKEGWCRGRLSNERGHRCALGAINHVSSPSVVRLHAQLLFTEEINESITYWNDRVPEKRYVTRALRRTARKLTQPNR